MKRKLGKGFALVLMSLDFMTLVIKAASLSADNERENYVESSQKMRKHPRLLLLRGEEKKLLKDIKRDSTWSQIHQSIIEVSNQLSKQP